MTETKTQAAMRQVREAQAAKRAKFVELAQKRVNKAIKAIALIGNLANKSNYSFDGDDIDQISHALLSAHEQTLDRFKAALGLDAAGKPSGFVLGAAETDAEDNGDG